jgi:hypothetical protein
MYSTYSKPKGLLCARSAARQNPRRNSCVCVKHADARYFSSTGVISSTNNSSIVNNSGVTDIKKDSLRQSPNNLQLNNNKISNSEFNMSILIKLEYILQNESINKGTQIKIYLFAIKRFDKKNP